MKKICLLIAAIAITSCTNKAQIDYAIIKGNITNLDDKELLLRGSGNIGGTFNPQSITANEDGFFIDTVKVAGHFYLYQKSNITPLYLKPGYTININFDSKDFRKTLAISGKGSEASSYLVLKSERGREGRLPKVNLQEEVEYKKTFYNIKKDQKELLNATKGLETAYRLKEERNLDYEYLVKLKRYRGLHSYYAKKKGFKPSNEFLSELKNIQVNNEEDFIFSSSYKTLVSDHYKNQASKLVEANKKLDGTIALLNICSAIENETIKNTLVFEAVSYPITRAENLKELYIAYKAAGTTNNKNNAKIEKSYNSLKGLIKGNPSPKFVNYENYTGGTTSLDDLKGKYVYIDVWATWCGPCIKEIPFLKEVEKKYHDKNIHFLSISVDKEKNYQKWKNMIVDEKLGGIQLLADNNFESQFIKDYLIKGIPKFILLDPKGNIVTANAPRPSDKKLVVLFNDLNI